MARTNNHERKIYNVSGSFLMPHTKTRSCMLLVTIETIERNLYSFKTVLISTRKVSELHGSGKIVVHQRQLKQRTPSSWSMYSSSSAASSTTTLRPVTPPTPVQRLRPTEEERQILCEHRWKLASKRTNVERLRGLLRYLEVHLSQIVFSFDLC